MPMFNFIQHLFTARALEREIAELKAANLELKSQLQVCQSEKEQLAKQVEKAQERVKRLKGPMPTKTDSDYDPHKW